MPAFLKRWLTQAAVGSTSAPASPSAPAGDRLDGLLDSVDELLFIVDDEGRIAATSGPLRHLLGSGEDQIVGRPAGEIFRSSPSLLSGATSVSVRFRSRSGVELGAIIVFSTIPVSDTRAFRVALLSDVGPEPVTEAEAALG